VSGMTNLPDLTSIRTDCLVLHADPLRLAVAAYLARFKGSSRHTESDLRCFLGWCAGHGLSHRPRSARTELYIRWMQEIRRFKPSTVSWRFSVAAGFTDMRHRRRWEHSPAEHVRRPPPHGSPTLVHPSAVRGPAHRGPAIPAPV
jgi:hypothetical protein